MRTLTLNSRFQYSITIVENDFIDHYMVKANGEYVKVYLLLLRYLNSPDYTLTISSLADCLECTEKDIIRALNYWSNEGLLKIEYDEQQVICGISILENSENQKDTMTAFVKNDSVNKIQTSAAEQSADVPVSTKLFTETLPKPTGKTIQETEPASDMILKSTCADHQEELKQLYFVAEQYMGKPLSVSEIQKINYFFDHLHFSTDLIEYLIEYCVENGHRSMHYIESVALAWSDANITTVTEAKASSATYSKNYFAVLKAFGIKGRNPAQVEVSYIKKWTEEYGFTLDIILEACNRTIAHTSKPDFKYTDSILKNWSAKNVHHLSDISRLDQAYQQEKTSRKRPVTKQTGNTNRFNNFEGRSYDITSLEQQLLNTP